jgi:CBS domain-containing protein
LVINLAVGEVMSRHPISIGAEATLLDALALMRGQKITGLPVVDDAGEVVGVLSQRDVARALAVKGSLPEVTDLFDLLVFGVPTQRSPDPGDFLRVLEETHVRDSMSTPPITIPLDASLELAADLMRKNEINRIPVLKGSRLVGIITRDDLVRALAHS